MTTEGTRKQPGIKLKQAGDEPASDSAPSSPPLVAVVMGSTSDWETMRHAAEVLKQFGVPHECAVVSAHRTPRRMAEFAEAAEGRGLEVIIAGAGGAAHLPGMVAAQTTVPVLAVAILANTRPELRERLRRFRDEQTAKVREATLPS